MLALCVKLDETVIPPIQWPKLSEERAVGSSINLRVASPPTGVVMDLPPGKMSSWCFALKPGWDNGHGIRSSVSLCQETERRRCLRGWLVPGILAPNAARISLGQLAGSKTKRKISFFSRV